MKKTETPNCQKKRDAIDVCGRMDDMETKRQKKEQMATQRDINSRIIKAMKEKNAALVDSLFIDYVNHVSEVSSDLFALMFCSLASEKDEVYLNSWMKFVNENDIRLSENAYTSIIKFYTGIRKEEVALKYVNLIISNGLKIRYRNYIPLLQSISIRGDIEKMRTIISHMRENEICIDEDAYNYMIKTCISAGDEGGVIHCIHDMIRAVQICQNGETIKTLQEFSDKFPKWSFKPCKIFPSGECDMCGNAMKRVELALDCKKKLAEELEGVIVSRSKEDGPDRMQNFDQFKQFLKENGPYDVILDGANIAHYKQNFDGGSFDYNQIQMIVEKLLEQNYKLLILLHEHHFGKDFTRLPEEWLEKKLAYKVIRGNNDDWYWMYASLCTDHNTMILSNDQMRDHFFQINNDQNFQLWRENSQIYYDLWTDAEKKKFILTFPKKFTQQIQENKMGFHFPFGTIEENMKNVTQYYCLVDTHLVENTSHSLKDMINAVRNECVVQ